MRRLMILALAAVAIYIAWTMWPSEEGRIRKRLGALAAAVSTGTAEHETQMSRLARVARLRQFLAPDLYVDVGEPYEPIEGRDVLLGMVARAALPPRDVSVRFVDVQVTLQADGSQATAYLTAEASSRTAEGAREIDARELQLTLRKSDREWVVSRVDLLRTLQ